MRPQAAALNDNGELPPALGAAMSGLFMRPQAAALPFTSRSLIAGLDDRVAREMRIGAIGRGSTERQLRHARPSAGLFTSFNIYENLSRFLALAAIFLSEITERNSCTTYHRRPQHG